MRSVLFCFIGIFLLNVNQAFAQSLADSIEVKQKAGTVYMQHGVKLKPKQLLKITEQNQEAYMIMKKAKSNYDIGSVIGSVGGFLIGWPLGTLIGGGDPNWAMAGVGVGLAVVSIPFYSAYNKHAKTAVRIYNDTLYQ